MREEEKKTFYEFLSKDAHRLSPELESLARQIVDCMIEVHRHLGAGHPEMVYESALCHENDLRQIPYQRQFPVHVSYKGMDVGESIIDILVAEKIVLELKSVDQLAPVHRAQIGSYLVALDLELGFLANLT